MIKLDKNKNVRQKLKIVDRKLERSTKFENVRQKFRKVDDILKASIKHVHLLLCQKLSDWEVLDECLSWHASHDLKQLDDLLGTVEIPLVRDRIVVGYLLLLRSNHHNVSILFTNRVNEQNLLLFPNILLHICHVTSVRLKNVFIS